MTYTVSVEGADAAARALDSAAAELAELDRTAGAAAAAEVLVAAQWGAPRRTGLLAGSGRVDTGPDAVAVVFGARYAPPVHSGVPSRNQAAQPFLDAAAQRKSEAVTATYRRAVDAIAARADR